MNNKLSYSRSNWNEGASDFINVSRVYVKQQQLIQNGQKNNYLEGLKRLETVKGTACEREG